MQKNDRELEERYKEAKRLNKETGETLNKLLFFDIFDETLGDRAIIITPHVIEVGANTNKSTSGLNTSSTISKPTQKTDSSKTKGSITSTPTRSEVDAFLKKGKQGTGKPAQKNQDLLAFLMEGKENQKLLEKHTNARVESERETF